MFYKGRKLERERREAEARGENLWVESFSQKVRTQISFALLDAVQSGYIETVVSRAHGLLLREAGTTFLAHASNSVDADFGAHFNGCDTEGFASCVEALHHALVGLTLDRLAMGGGNTPYESPKFDNKVREILATERVAWDFIKGRMTPFASREMHVEVVEPVLTLLGGDGRYAATESAYQDALKEIAANQPADAITDAGRALQEMLTALGCEGNSLGPLLTSARKRGLFGPYDYRLTEVVSQAVEWVSADRSQMGDAHAAGARIREDAWLTVHVVGAVILRLTAGNRSQ
jgi:hypothetical protein